MGAVAQSLRARILLITCAVVLTAIGTVVATNAYLAAREYESALQSRTLAIAKGLQMQLERVLQFGIGLDQLTGFEEQCQQTVAGYPGIDFAVVHGRDGRVLFASVQAPDDAGAVDAASLATVHGGQQTTVRAQGRSGDWHKAVVPVVGADGAVHGSIVVGFRAALVGDKIRALLISALGAGSLVLAAGLLVLNLALGAFVTRPLRSLIATVAELRRRPLDLTRRASVRSTGELGELAHAFNELMDDLEHTTVSKGDLEAALVALRGASDALHAQKERAEVTLGSIGDAVVTTDAAGRLEYLNPAAQALTGLTIDRAAGRHLGELLRFVRSGGTEPMPDPLLSQLEGADRPGSPGQLDLLLHDGRSVAVDSTAALIHDRGGLVTGGVLTLRDVSAQRAMARQREWEASHDALTGLANRREFADRIEAAMAAANADGTPHVVCFMDLDSFKVVNDTCGHAAGDELLKSLAALLASRVRRSDTLARLGGDEFALLMPGCSIERARFIAADLLAAVRDHAFEHRGKLFQVGVSIGLAQASVGQTGADVMSMADTACYWAKAQGRNRVCVYRDGDSEMAVRQREVGWVARLNAALRDGRFTLYHQTYLALDGNGGERRHLEVLLRMVDESGQLVSPGSFLPAAERYNLMPSIDRWVIEQVLSGYAGLLAADPGRPLTCAINLSGTTLNSEGLLDFVRRQLSAHQVPAGGICFEITETAAINNLKSAAAFIADCRALGVRFALDDFGTGTSSFGYLKKLPVDYLKIDGGFVRNLLQDPVDRVMTETINHMAHVMGIQTVAEYAENASIIAALRSIGVDYAQGFGVAVPSPLFPAHAATRHVDAGRDTEHAVAL